MALAAIEFRMLGPLEARLDGVSVPLGGPKQRALVALLLLHANDVVPLDVLIEELWDGTPPPSAPAYVQNCVSRLRKGIGAETLETRAPGYRLRVDPDVIDARRFELLVRAARPLPARERAAALRQALALWRGTPLSDLAYWSFAQDAIRNLEEHRVNAVRVPAQHSAQEPLATRTGARPARRCAEARDGARRRSPPGACMDRAGLGEVRVRVGSG